MQSKQYFTKIKNYPHEKSTEPGKSADLLYLFNDPLKEGKGWLEKYYLYQVPTTEILLNPSLEQNPGW